MSSRTLKARLIAEMGNSVNDVAKAAADRLRQRGWLEDGSLQRANLWAANLRGANLQNANLREADLMGAYLMGANLMGDNLMGANLRHAKFNKTTTLPDGTKWTPETDMTRFTDPDHPDFWRSDTPSSPAYRGKDSD